MARVRKKSDEESGVDKYLDALLGARFYWSNKMESSFWKPEQEPGDNTIITYNLSNFDTSNGWAPRFIWTDSETESFKAALKTWEAVANVVFVRVDKEQQADWVFAKTAWDFDDADDRHALSDMDSPRELGEGAEQARGVFNTDHPLWTDSETGNGTNVYSGAGSAIFHAFLREIGHGLGLEYSDDVFGGQQNIMPGELNSVMGELAGTPMSSTLEGYAAGPLAYDIAAIQALYGKNDTHNDGNTVYELKDWGEPEGASSDGAHWETIWDTGGTDSIIYNGRENVVINLNPATLDGSKAGGGKASFVENILGGFTIAKDVEIEEAHGGAGDDRLYGNGQNNRLEGGEGNDRLYAGGGSENTLVGGAGIDSFVGGTGDDTFIVDGDDTFITGGGGYDTVIVRDVNGGHVILRNGNDHTQGGESVRQVFGDRGDDKIDASGIKSSPGNWAQSVYVRGGQGDDEIAGTEAGGDEIYGGADNDSIWGTAGGDSLYGGAGDDLVHAGSHNNEGASFFGGADNDTLSFLAVKSTTVFAGDFPNRFEMHRDVTVGLDWGYGEVANRYPPVVTANGVEPGEPEKFIQEGFENVIGGWGNDTIYGDAGDNELVGHEGADQLFGGRGNDTLTGDGYSEMIDPEDVTGLIFGDRFNFTLGDGNDTITDFEHGIDKIVFSATEIRGFDDLTIRDVSTVDGHTDHAMISYGDGGDTILVHGGRGLLDTSDFVFE